MRHLCAEWSFLLRPSDRWVRETMLRVIPATFVRVNVSYGRIILSVLRKKEHHSVHRYSLFLWEEGTTLRISDSLTWENRQHSAQHYPSLTWENRHHYAPHTSLTMGGRTALCAEGTSFLRWYTQGVQGGIASLVCIYPGCTGWYSLPSVHHGG